MLKCEYLLLNRSRDVPEKGCACVKKLSGESWKRLHSLQRFGWDSFQGPCSGLKVEGLIALQWLSGEILGKFI